MTAEVQVNNICTLNLMVFSKLPIPWRTHSFKVPTLLSLLKTGFPPTTQDFNNFLAYLSQTQRFQCVFHLFSQMNSNHIKVDRRTLTILTTALLKQHKYEEALHFLRTHLGKAKILDQNGIFDALIQGYCRFENDPDTGLMLLRGLLDMDVVVPFPSSFTFCSLIYGFSSRGEMGKVVEVLELMTCEKFNFPYDNYVCSSVISGFLRIGKPELALLFYENAVNTGVLKPNIVTYTALLNTYFMLGRIVEVSDLVSRMNKDGMLFDVVFYTSWICGYFRDGMIEEAFRKYREMIDRKLEMDTIAYTVLIDGVSKEGNVEKAVGFLSKMLKSGVRPNLVTFTALMLGFSKKRKMQEALALFKMLEDFGIQADEFSYAVLIDGFCKRLELDCVFQLLDEMETKGIKPSVITYNIVINGLCKAGRTSEADEFSKSVAGDVFTYSTLLHGYIEEGNTMGMLETKTRFEAAGVRMDVVMCNVLIKALFMIGMFEDALSIYKGLPEADLVATSITYSTMIYGFCKAGMFDEALEIFDDFRRASKPTDACYECIIHGLCQKGMVDMAVGLIIELVERSFSLDKKLYMRLLNKIYDAEGAEGIHFLINRMKDSDCELFEILGNYAISFLCKKNSSAVVVDLLLVMIKKGSFVTSSSYYSILKNLLSDKSFFTRIIFAMFLKQHSLAEPRVNRTMVNYMCMNNVMNAWQFVKNLNGETCDTNFTVYALQTLLKYGRALDAYEVLVEASHKLPDVDSHTFSSIINGLCREGYLHKALELCGFMRESCKFSSIAAYNVIINELLHQGCLIEALRLFDSLVKVNMLPSEITYAVIIDSLSREGLLVDARRMFDNMSQKNMKPNIRAYNSLIHGYCKLGHVQEALKLFLDLEMVNLKPDEFTASALLFGYCQKGDTEKALEFFSECKSKSMSPDFLGFMYLIRGLIAKGRMEESRSILREMLQNQSVVNILSTIDIGNEMESVHGFLVILCERGNIQEAVSILDEIGSTSFPLTRRPSGTDTFVTNEARDVNLTERSLSKSLKTTGEVSKPLVWNSDKLDTIYKSKDGEISKFLRVDSSYAYIASLCSEGYISDANKMVQRISDLL